MKNLKQLVLPCYKVEIAMSVEAWYFLHGSTDGVCNLTFFFPFIENDCRRSTEYQTRIELCHPSRTGGLFYAGTG